MPLRSWHRGGEIKVGVELVPHGTHSGIRAAGGKNKIAASGRYVAIPVFLVMTVEDGRTARSPITGTCSECSRVLWWLPITGDGAAPLAAVGIRWHECEPNSGDVRPCQPPALAAHNWNAGT